jgi:hypothetical protein
VEGLDPRGATRRVCCENDVVVARFEGVRKVLDGRSETWKHPIVVVGHQWLRPPLPHREFGYIKIIVTVALDLG